MEEIVKFSRLLRESDIPVSIRSSKTAHETYNLFKDDLESLEYALAAVYVKNSQQRSKFQKLFKTVFLGEGSNGNSEASGPCKKEGSMKNRRFIRSNYTFRIREPEEVQHRIMESDITGYRPPLDEYLNPNMDESEILKKDIVQLTSFEPELLELCQKLGKKIANKRVRRRRQAKKMHPDIRKTIRKNLKHGGALVDIVKTKPRIKKSNHFFLNDVSGSCDWVSNWFFCMVYAAQNSFKKARTFEFDNKTVETTDALGESNLLDAFIKVRDMRQKNLMIHGTSNMFKAFEGFKASADLNNKSYVLILSDCRDWAGPKNNGRPMSTDIMEQIVDKSKKVLVLNPESKKKWNVADSCVSEYEDVGAEFHEVRNLEQLAQLISEI